MSNLLGSRIAGGNTAYQRAKSDYYPTPPEATQALLDFLQLPKETVIWEPACGDGHMVDVIRSNGYSVVASDILDGTDYLCSQKPDGVNYIITNPPFSQAKEFIKRSIYHNIPFAFLLKSQFWHAKNRYDLFYQQPPTWILPLTWRPDFLFKTRGNGSPLMDVMWCVWIPCQTFTQYRPLQKPDYNLGDNTDE